MPCGWVLGTGRLTAQPTECSLSSGGACTPPVTKQLWLGAGSPLHGPAILSSDLLEPCVLSRHRSAQLLEMPAAAWQHKLCGLAFSLHGPHRSWTVSTGTAQGP